MSVRQQPRVELVLMQPNDWFQGEELEAANAQIGKQTQLLLSTDDIEAQYQIAEQSLHLCLAATISLHTNLVLVLT